ncbi:MAG: hypothetical protein H8D92_02400 [Pelagibacteraceae bacterium]|nr:hypothetical protein [Pelagibacteraceae bacterium]
MEIAFETKHLDKNLYSRMILHYIYEHYSYTDHERLREQDKWKINIKDVKSFDNTFYNGSNTDNLDYSIPHGVTGLGDVTCYLTDSTNPLVRLQNMSVICHELAHMILMIYYPDAITKQRYDDFYGKTGTDRKFFSSEVHDRVAEGRVKQFKYPLNRFRRIKYVGVDIEDITNSRKVRRI